MKAIYMCLFGVTEAQKRIVLDHGSKTLMLKEDEMLCRVEHHFLRWTTALCGMSMIIQTVNVLLTFVRKSHRLHDVLGGAQWP